MTVHVDLVETHWSGGYQERVARVVADTERLQVDGIPHWQQLVLGVLADAGLQEQPDRALDALCAHFKGDYAHATDPHDDADCPFASGERVPFTSDPVRQPQVATAT